MIDEQTHLLSLKAAYAFGAVHGLQQEISEIRDMAIEWDKPYTSSLRRGYIVALFEKHGLFETFTKRHWSVGESLLGNRMRSRFLRIKDQYEAFLVGKESESDDEIEERGSAGQQSEDTLAFALEAHLRDFLAKNMERIEPGLRLYDAGERKGIEFPIDKGRIDLLAIDQYQKYVVIELKLSHGRNKTLGQLLYYMGWIDKHLGGGPCRGLIIANEIDKELSICVARVPGVSLARYRMSFAIESVGAS
jgi:hypothetical protein